MQLQQDTKGNIMDIFLLTHHVGGMTNGQLTQLTYRQTHHVGGKFLLCGIRTSFRCNTTVPQIGPSYVE